MLKQAALLAQLRAACHADKRVVAAVLGGSCATGEMDAYSDIDCVLFFEPAALATLDRAAWVAQLAPLALFFADDFGHFTAIFADLVRAEFHFDPADQMARVDAWAGSVWFPALAAAVLVDRTGELSRRLQPLVGGPPQRDTAAAALRLIQHFGNFVLFGLNVLERGELARALDVLSLLHRYLLHLARLVEGATAHWPTPSRALEHDLSPAAYARLQACTARLNRAELVAAYQAAWGWGLELGAVLAARHGLAWPLTLAQPLAERVARLA